MGTGLSVPTLRHGLGEVASPVQSRLAKVQEQPGRELTGIRRVQPGSGYSKALSSGWGAVAGVRGRVSSGGALATTFSTSIAALCNSVSMLSRELIAASTGESCALCALAISRCWCVRI